MANSINQSPESPSHLPDDPPSQQPGARTVTVLARGSACFSCRRRKQRCDGTRPICNQCVRFKRGSECVFEDRPRNQVQILEDRVRELEALVAQAMRNQPSFTPSSDSPGHVHAGSIASGGDGASSGGELRPVLEDAGESALPRPDIALVASPQTQMTGWDTPTAVPAEITNHL
jgi:hypothetical protein